MTTFQALSNYWANNEDSITATKKLIENSWLKIEVKIPSTAKLAELIKHSREAIDDAKHLATKGDQSYFDELVQRDLAS